MNIIKILALFLIPLNGLAQYSYVEFPTDSVRWIDRVRYGVSEENTVTVDFERMLNGKDTLIDGNVYKQLLSRAKFNYSELKDPTPELKPFSDTIKFEYWIGLREENKKIYMYNYGSESVIYDFNLEIGDTIPQPVLYSPTIVAGIDTIEIGDSFRKRFRVKHDELNFEYFIYEGIGSGLGLLPSVPYNFYLELICVSNYHNDYLIYTSPNYQDCFTEITTTIEPNKNLEGNELDLTPSISTNFVNAISKNGKLINKILVFNGSGKLVLSRNVNQAETKINLSNLKSGFYIFVIESNYKTFSKKVIKI